MSESPIKFCTQLARAIAQGTKTLTYKPLTVAEASALAAGKTPKSPYGQPGDVLWVDEPWGTARGKIIHLANCAPDGFRQPVTYPVGYHPGSGPLARANARLLLDVVAIDIVNLQAHNEKSAKATVNAPSEGRTTYLDELKAQWATAYYGPHAWDANPLCWRVKFKQHV